LGDTSACLVAHTSNHRTHYDVALQFDVDLTRPLPYLVLLLALILRQIDSARVGHLCSFASFLGAQTAAALASSACHSDSLIVLADRSIFREPSSSVLFGALLRDGAAGQSPEMLPKMLGLEGYVIVHKNIS
jgi:hypothetical protein